MQVRPFFFVHLQHFVYPDTGGEPEKGMCWLASFPIVGKAHLIRPGPYSHSPRTSRFSALNEM